MWTSIATVCVSGTLPEKLEAIAAARFTAVEIFETDLIAWPGTPRDVRQMCEDLGLDIVTCQPFRDFEGLPEVRRAKAFDRAERKFDLLQELGSDLLFVCSSVSPEAQGGIDRIAADFAELGERAAKRSMRVGYEALAWAPLIHDYRDAWEVVRRAGRDNVGLVLDSFHIQSRNLDLSPIRAIPGDRIFLVQLADAPKLQMDYLSWSRHWRCMPGQGDFDLASFMDALAATDYDGYLSLEIFNDRFRAGSARSVAVDGHRSLISLLDDAGRRRGAPIPGAVTMPPPAPVGRVAFLEFAVHEQERPGFAAMLAALGFAEIGQHRSKEVTLFAQGTIRIVLNSDKEGFAHSYQITHGTSVCAIALETADACATVERARKLFDDPHNGPVGPGELDIPAVRGLGGSLLHFLDRGLELSRWAETDFVMQAPPRVGIGLSEVDHISQSMQYEEMLTWLLFYSTLFAARKMPSQAVIDPVGVVQSQVIESGGLRLVLNGSQSHRTLSSRFVTDFFGSGVQHVALSSQDLKATVRAARAAGITMLPIPENYYEDVAARTDLSDAEIEEMKALDILYDRDGQGEFWQAYTETLDGGFFFELVQRGGGYAGYGAANAPIRLAAQARTA